MLPQEAGMPDNSGNPGRSRKKEKARNQLIEVRPTAVRTLQPLPPGVASGPDMNALLGALKRRWPLAFTLGVLLAAGAAFGAWTIMSWKYTAFAQIQVHSTSPFVVRPNVDAGDSRNLFVTYQKTQASEVKRHDVLSLAFEHPDVVALGIAHNHADPIAWLEDELKIEFQDNSEIMTVNLTGTDPDEVKALVRAVTEAYDRLVAQKEPLLRKARLREQQKIYDEKTKVLAQKKEKMHDMAEKLGFSDSGVLALKQTNMLQVLGQKQAALVAAEREWSRAKARLDTYKSREQYLKKPAVSENDLSLFLDNDRAAQVIQADLARQQKTLANYEERKTETAYIRAEGQVKNLQKALEKRREELRKTLHERVLAQAKQNYETALVQLEAEIKPLAEEKESLKGEVSKLSEQAEQVGRFSTELEMLKEAVRGEQQFVDHLQNEIAGLEAEQNARPRAELHQAAALQKKDLKRQLAATIAAPVFVLLLVGLGVAWWEFRARRIQSPDEVTQGLGIRVVGAVPNLPVGARTPALALAQQDKLGHHLLESIDGIRTLLLKDATEAATRVVMVTSAVAGEGKTTLASHLASSLARAGRKTLLIDCDLRGPAAHQLFELPLQPGLSEILLEEIDPDHAIQTTNVDGLWLLSAGQWDREVMYALARDGVKLLFDRLKEEFDFIIVDSHPILPATDSLLVGQHADAVILSILRDVSQSPRVFAACQRLSTLGIRILGAVVSGTNPDEIYAPCGNYSLAAK
ncbi:MAG: polysaccharide biosynthesis tyrosine autokinase [Gemmataceae bacterium]